MKRSDFLEEQRCQGFAEKLKRMKIFQFGQFRIKLHETQPDAPLSPYYINLRLLRSYPGLMSHATFLLGEKVSSLCFDLIADVPTGGTPFATLLSQELEKGMITPRLDKKGHGSGALIDGVYRPGQVVLLVDDVITNAESKIRAVQLLRVAGLEVNDVCVLVDREQGGAQELEKVDCRLHAVMTISELLEYYREMDLITAEEFEKIQAYRREYA